MTEESHVQPPAADEMSAASPIGMADTGTPAPKQESRFYALDGWRAISILAVLAGHMLPLGPPSLHLNSAAGQIGMSLFFTLSGFLITTQLYKRRHLGTFFIRRLFRIVPLAWAYILVVTVLLGGSFLSALLQGAFTINYLSEHVLPASDHFWSLCVEVHFYAGIGLFMAVTGFRGFRLLPLIWFGLVIARLFLAPQGTIETHLRVDEILGGSCLGLVHLGLFGKRPRAFLERMPFFVPALLLLITSHALSGPLGAFRSFFAASLVGHTLFRSEQGGYSWLGHPFLRYVSEVSYAVYVFHPLTYAGWFGEGERLVKYLKRILSFALTFGLAHLSTHYYELPLTQLGRRLAKTVEGSRAIG